MDERRRSLEFVEEVIKNDKTSSDVERTKMASSAYKEEASDET